MKHCDTCTCGPERARCPVCGEEHEVLARLAGGKVVGCPYAQFHTVWFLNDRYFRRIVEPGLYGQDEGLSFFSVP